MKAKRLCILLLLGTFVLLLSCIFFTTLGLAWIDFRRFSRYDWPRNLEHNSLFWMEMCMAAVEVQILLPCFMRWFRLLCSRPAKHKEITPQMWFKRFAILTFCVVLLALIALWRRRIYIPLIREQWDWAWVFANRYYPFVIADLFTIGAWIRWVISGMKSYFVTLKATL